MCKKSRVTGLINPLLITLNRRASGQPGGVPGRRRGREVMGSRERGMKLHGERGGRCRAAEVISAMKCD